MAQSPNPLQPNDITDLFCYDEEDAFIGASFSDDEDAAVREIIAANTNTQDAGRVSDEDANDNYLTSSATWTASVDNSKVHLHPFTETTGPTNQLPSTAEPLE